MLLLLLLFLLQSHETLSDIRYRSRVHWEPRKRKRRLNGPQEVWSLRVRPFHSWWMTRWYWMQRLCRWWLMMKMTTMTMTTTYCWVRLELAALDCSPPPPPQYHSFSTTTIWFCGHLLLLDPLLFDAVMNRRKTGSRTTRAAAPRTNSDGMHSLMIFHWARRWQQPWWWWFVVVGDDDDSNTQHNGHNQAAAQPVHSLCLIISNKGTTSWSVGAK